MIIITILSLVPATAVLATSASDRLGAVGETAGFGGGASLPVVIGGVIAAILALLGIVFMAYIIYAGWVWMTARGDEEKIKKAKATIRGNVIGLVIVLSAYIITAAVIDRLTTATNFQDAVSEEE